jgi:hypothetical protein
MKRNGNTIFQVEIKSGTHFDPTVVETFLKVKVWVRLELETGCMEMEDEHS